MFLLILVASILYHTNNVSSSQPMEGRYSFSLTTFNPDGKLPQLSHAVKATSLGPPVLAISMHQVKNHTSNSSSNTVAFTSLQTLPSPLMKDDGTPRFVRITNNIAMGHTGIGGDGRIVCHAAQRLAMEHEYTFDEEIPINILLEEMGMLFQEYTMKVGARPFGCSLVVAYLGNTLDLKQEDEKEAMEQNGKTESKLYTIDPSGCVTYHSDGVVYLGRGERDTLLRKLRQEKKEGHFDSVEKVQETIRNFFIHEDTKNQKNPSSFSLTFVDGIFTRDDFSIHRTILSQT